MFILYHFRQNAKALKVFFCYNNYMKYFYTLLALLCVVPCFAQEESRLFVAPGRETYVHFPTKAFGEKYTLRVYLPEVETQKAQKYPVIYVLGLEKDFREAVKKYLEHNSALVVWVDFKPSDFEADKENIVQFFAQELLPYIDVNYFTFDTPEKRILAVYGEPAAKVAAELLQKPNLFNFASFSKAQNGLETLKMLPAYARVSVSGTQRDLALAERALEKAGARLGTGFTLHYDDGQKEILQDVDLNYFFAPAAQLVPVKLQAFLSENKLLLETGKMARLQVVASLKNKMVSSYVPESLRISPPFLEWDALNGTLRVRSGAEAGKVKISADAANLRFKTGLKLKKP